MRPLLLARYTHRLGLTTLLRASDFGLLSAFGFRVSDFEASAGRLQSHVLGSHLEALVLVFPDHGGVEFQQTPGHASSGFGQ